MYQLNTTMPFEHKLFILIVCPHLQYDSHDQQQYQQQQQDRNKGRHVLDVGRYRLILLQ